MKFLQFILVLGIAAIVASTQVKAQVVEIGTGTAVSTSLPMEPYYGYTYSQTLFLQSELNIANKRISKIAYHYNGTGTFTDQVAVYIGYTNLQKLTMWAPAAQMTKVFEGAYPLLNVDGWYEIVLTTPFEYNNTENLIIAFDENTTGYHGSTNDFFATAATDTMSISYYADALNPDPLNPPATPLGTGANPSSSTVNRLKYRPNIRITFSDIPTGPQILVSPSSLNYGITEAGVGVVTRYVTFSNTGVSDLTITGVTGMSAPFSVNLSTSIVLSPGAQSSPTAIVFAPVAAGSFDQTVSFVSNATSGDASLVLHGEAYPQGIIYESFEGTFPPNGWEATPSAQWTQGTSPYDGAKNAYLASGKAGILITPKLNITATDSLVFYARKSSSSTTAQLLVKFSPDKTNWTQLLAVPLTATYARYVVYLSTAAGLNYIGFDGVGVTYLDFVRGPLIYISTTPPEPATNPVPADGAVDILLSTNLSWQGLINATGYKISIGTDNPPTNLVNNVDLGNVTTYALSGLNYSTQYYWKVVGYNQYGDCPNPTVWNFTTMANPLITSFPYVQGFENNNGLVPPLGWTGNLWSRGTEANSGLYCARVSYSHTGTAILQTPYINLPANMRINFYWKDDDISTAKGAGKRINDKVAAHDTTFFEVSVNDGANWTTLAMLAEPSQATAYKFEQVNLSAYAGNNVLLRWRDITDATSGAWGTGLDDITIEQIPVNPVATIDPTAWSAGNVVIGTSAQSGNTFTMTNTGSGTLTITSLTDLSGTEFTTNLVTGGALTTNQSQTFGFTYSPVNLGNDTVQFVIETNGGNVTVLLTGKGINPVSWTSEGFESAVFPPEGWTTIDNDNDTYNWFVIDNVTYAHTGSKCAGSDSWYNNVPLTPDNFLVSPQFMVSEETGILKWWVAGQDPDYVADHYGVFISTTGYAAADFTTSLYDETISTSEWLEREVDLSAYMGQQVYIAFRHFNCTDMYVMKIDDISLSAIATEPIATVTPASWNAGSVVLGNTALSGNIFSIKNTGTGVLTISALTDLSGTEFSTSLETAINLAANESHAFSFTYTPSGLGIDSVDFVIETNGGNVTMVLTGKGIENVEWTFEGFEGDVFPPEAWTLIDNDEDTYNWTVLDNADAAHTGNKAARSHSWISNNVLTPDNFLVAPQFTVTAEKAMLKWWVASHASGSAFFGDHYGVFISTTGNTAADFTTVLFEETLSFNVWEDRLVDLSAYMGMDVYIAFRHFDCTDMYAVKIDDVELLSWTNVAPEFTSTPVVVAFTDSVYTYNITASDVNGDELEFDATELPEWLTLTDNGDGTAILTGTPVERDTVQVAITVTDGENEVEQVFTIIVKWPDGINNNIAANFTVYPNPASGFIKVSGISNASVTIFNAIGKVVATHSNVNAETALNVNTLPVGCYFIRVTDGDTVRTLRFNISK